MYGRDFPGGPVVKIFPSNAGSMGWIPGLKSKTLKTNKKNTKKQYCNKFNKGFKNGPHFKKLKKKKYGIEL